MFNYTGQSYIGTIRDSRYLIFVSLMGKIYHFDEPKDSESVKLQAMLKEEPLEQVIKETTGLKDEALIKEIEASYQAAEK